MKAIRGIFTNERVLILEFGMEFPWEGIMRGLAKEAGEYYFYVLEDLSGKTHYVPRDAVQRISRIGKENKRRLRHKLAPVLRLVRKDAT